MIAEDIDGDARTVRVVLGEGELMLLANVPTRSAMALRSMDFEFSTRFAVERSEARKLLADLGGRSMR